MVTLQRAKCTLVVGPILFHSIPPETPRRLLSQEGLLKSRSVFVQTKHASFAERRVTPAVAVTYLLRPLGGPGFDLLESPPEGESRLIRWGKPRYCCYIRCSQLRFETIYLLKTSDVILNNLEENCSRGRYFPRTQTLIFNENNNFENIHIHSTQIQ